MQDLNKINNKPNRLLISTIEHKRSKNTIHKSKSKPANRKSILWPKITATFDPRLHSQFLKSVTKEKRVSKTGRNFLSSHPHCLSEAQKPQNRDIDSRFRVSCRSWRFLGSSFASSPCPSPSSSSFCVWLGFLPAKIRTDASGPSPHVRRQKYERRVS